MDIRDRVFGPISEGSGRGEISVDFGELVRKLVLAEHFVVESDALKEFPLMVRKFGYDGVRELLDSGLIHVQCELTCIASLQDNSTAVEEPPVGAYRFGSFRADQSENLENYFHRLNDIPDLNDRQARIVREKIADCIVEPPSQSGEVMLTQLHTDIKAGSPILKLSVAQVATRYMGRPLSPTDFSFTAFHVNPKGSEGGVLRDFPVVQTQTDLGERFDLSDREVHEIVELGLHSVGNLNQRLELMERFRAVTGFKSGELRLFEQKLAFLARQLDPDTEEERFVRVMELANLPDVDPDPDVRDVDLPRLIEIVQRDEARAFRGWLRGIDTMSDQDIRGEIGKLRASVRAAVQSRAGKAVRFGVATGAGLIPGAGLVAGPAISAVDSFVVDSLISKPGPTAFISHLYPSVFVGKGQR